MARIHIDERPQDLPRQGSPCKILLPTGLLELTDLADCTGAHAVDGPRGCHHEPCRGRAYCTADCPGCPDLPANKPKATRRKARVTEAASSEIVARPAVEDGPWPDPKTPGHPAGVVYSYTHVSDEESGLALEPSVGRFRMWWVSRGDGSTQRDEPEGCSGSYTVEGDVLCLQTDTREDEGGSHRYSSASVHHRSEFRQKS